MDSKASSSAGAGEKGGGIGFVGLAELDAFAARCLTFGGISAGYEMYVDI